MLLDISDSYQCFFLQGWLKFPDLYQTLATLTVAFLCYQSQLAKKFEIHLAANVARFAHKIILFDRLFESQFRIIEE